MTCCDSFWCLTYCSLPCLCHTLCLACLRVSPVNMPQMKPRCRRIRRPSPAPFSPSSHPLRRRPTLMFCSLDQPPTQVATGHHVDTARLTPIYPTFDHLRNANHTDGHFAAQKSDTDNTFFIGGTHDLVLEAQPDRSPKERQRACRRGGVPTEWAQDTLGSGKGISLATIDV